MNFYCKNALILFVFLNLLACNVCADGVDIVYQNNCNRANYYNLPISQDEPTGIKKLSGYTDNINNILTDRNKVDTTRIANPQQKKKMFQAVMSAAIIYTHAGQEDVQLSKYLNHRIDSNNILFNHFEILRCVANFSIFCARKVDLTQHRDLNSLVSLSGLSLTTITEWYEESYRQHSTGINLRTNTRANSNQDRRRDYANDDDRRIAYPRGGNQRNALAAQSNLVTSFPSLIDNSKILSYLSEDSDDDRERSRDRRGIFHNPTDDSDDDRIDPKYKSMPNPNYEW